MNMFQYTYLLSCLCTQEYVLSLCYISDDWQDIYTKRDKMVQAKKLLCKM